MTSAAETIGDSRVVRGRGEWTKADAGFCLLLLGISSIWWMAVSFPLIHYDDPFYVRDNAYVLNGISGTDVAWAFTTSHMTVWMPLTWLSLQLDATLFHGSAQSVWGFHATNVAFHVANVILAYFLLLQFGGEEGRRRWLSFIGALLFAIHPERVESVAWVTERKDVLAGFFGLLAVHLYIRWRRRGGTGRYVGVCALFLCSMMAKPMVVMLPVLLMVLDFWPLGRWQSWGSMWPLFREKAPLFLISAAASVNTLMFQFTMGTLHERFSTRVQNAIVSYALYLRDFVGIGHRSILYPLVQYTWVQVAGAAGVLGIVCAGVWFCGRRWRGDAGKAVVVGWLWFVISMLPASGLVQSGMQSRADRFMYWPSLGLSILFGLGLLGMVKRFRVVANGMVLCGAAFFFVLTAIRLQQWSDPLLLYEHDLKGDDGNATLHLLAGIAAEERGMKEVARKHLERAHELDPRNIPLAPEHR
ncbi:MAG: hypothetical protein ACTHN5_18915 [Phycisphaerae bacterium]